MGFFDSIKHIKKQIDQIESTVYSGKQSLIEVYERNACLEAEIAARTIELATANKQMKSDLQNAWLLLNDYLTDKKYSFKVLEATPFGLNFELRKDDFKTSYNIKNHNHRRYHLQRRKKI